MKRSLAVLAATALGGGKIEVRATADESAWFLDPDLVRLRTEWIKAFNEWRQTANTSPGAVPTTEQRAKLRRYHNAEAAYFARYHALTNRRR